MTLGGILARALLGGLCCRGANRIRQYHSCFTTLPAWAAAFICAGVLAAVMSTAGCHLSAFQIFANDIYRRTIAPRISSNQDGKKLIQSAY